MDQHTQDVLRLTWEERVRGKPIFHGMSSSNLTDPLDSTNDPFKLIRPTLYRLVEVLQGLVVAGFKFTVREEHFGKRYANDLRLILAWTRNDLDNPGIDFTTSYYDACGYADCCQGSQLRENFRYLTDHLPDCKDDPIVRRRMGPDEWSLVADMSRWIARDADQHRSIVLWADRSCPAFDPDHRCRPLGSFEGFSRKVLASLRKADLPCTRQMVDHVLPAEGKGFTVRMSGTLTKAYIMRIDEVTPEKVATATGPRGVG